MERGAATLPRLDIRPWAFQNNVVSSDKFESLSDEALYSLAEKMGLDLPQGLERVFVIEEILDDIADDDQERLSSGRASNASVHIEATKFSGAELDDVESCMDGSPCLEQRYNETSIRIIVRDPSWAFAFWDVADAEREKLRSEEGGMSLFLRVAEIVPACDGRREFFDIPISEDDLQWYINFPHPEARYRVDLCARSGAHIRLLARSDEIHLPRALLCRPVSELEGETAELMRLSGSAGLDIEPEEEENPQRILKSGVE
jgi:uncharacterized protein